MNGYAGQGSGTARPAIPGMEQGNPAVSNRQGTPSAPPAKPDVTTPGTSQPQTPQQIRDNLRQQIQDAARSGRDPQIIIPNDFRNVVPQGAVNISIAFFVAIAAIVIVGPFARAMARRADAQSRALAEAGRLVSPQIRQLQESVDAMAIELERISEAQRFQAKLLVGKERDGAPADR